jgi:hypothetical protein
MSFQFLFEDVVSWVELTFFKLVDNLCFFFATIDVENEFVFGKYVGTVEWTFGHWLGFTEHHESGNLK